ncbi:MAG: H-NS histone family protein [Lysobacteraceae bacterium]
MAIELGNLSPEQLNELIVKAEQQKKKIHRERVGEVRRKLTAMAKAEGYTIEELFGSGGGRKSGGKVPPKYQNPSDPTQTWTGRGKRPNWFKDLLASGKKESDLLI